MRHLPDLGLLLLRVATAGFLLFGHGWGKLANFGARAPGFRDPLGVGSEVSLALAVFAEVFCALLVIAGAFTRLALVPMIITMLVAAGVVHAADPWAKKELALLFAVPFITLLLTGPGKFSVDGLRRKA